MSATRRHRRSELLTETGYGYVATIPGKLDKGYAAEVPYDLILFNGTVNMVSSAMFDQLR